MKVVPGKTLEQQDIQALNRRGQRLVNHRTALVSQMRGLLLDRGIAFAQSITRARREIRSLLEERGARTQRAVQVDAGSALCLFLGAR